MGAFSLRFGGEEELWDAANRAVTVFNTVSYQAAHVKLSATFQLRTIRIDGRRVDGY